jgi:hypothetical protein
MEATGVAERKLRKYEIHIVVELLDFPGKFCRFRRNIGQELAKGAYGR